MENTLRERMARAICERALAQTCMRLAEKGEVYKFNAEQWRHHIQQHMDDPVFGSEFREQADAAIAAMQEGTEGAT